MLVLPDTPLHGGQELAERLRRRFEAAPTQVQDGAPIPAIVSFGVVTVDCSAPGQAPSHRALVGAADELMYQAKHGGRNQVRARQLG
jgi:diguanylate cyclase (GGDEF)-like protein